MTSYRYDEYGLYIDDLRHFLQEDEPCRPTEKGVGQSLRSEQDMDQAYETPQEAEAETHEALQAHAYFEEEHAADEHLKSAESLSARIRIMQIETLEQPRAVREFVLTGNREKLEDIDGRISRLREQLA